MTAQGSPTSIFKRAIEHGNFVYAEMTAHDVGRLTVDESLALTALAVGKGPGRRSRYMIRWLRRLLEEDKTLTIEEAALAASALAVHPSESSVGGSSPLIRIAGLSMARRMPRGPGACLSEQVPSVLAGEARIQHRGRAGGG